MNNIEDEIFSNKIAVDGQGRVWLSDGGLWIQIFGKLKKTIANFYNLLNWI